MQGPLLISTVSQTRLSSDTSCYFPCNRYNCWTLFRCTFTTTLLFVTGTMLWIFADIISWCICNAKFLSKSFIASALCLRCSRTNNELSLGERMHLKCIYFFQVLCFIFCSVIIPYLNKTAESYAVFSKVSFLAIFARNKIGEKYYANFSCEGVWAPEGHEGVLEAQTGMAHAARFPGHMGPARSAASHLAFVYAFIYIEKGVTCEMEAIHETERCLIRLKHIYNFWCSILVYEPFALCFVYTLWRFYAFFGTNLLTRCHGASSLFFAIFVFQKSYTRNILGIGWNKSWSP
jgi:hypothetical protein